MPTPVQPPAHAGWGVPPSALVPSTSSQQPRTMEPPRIKPEPYTPPKNEWPASMSAGVKSPVASQKKRVFENYSSGGGFSVPPQQTASGRFISPINPRPLTTGTPLRSSLQLGQPGTGSEPPQADKGQRTGERSAHSQMLDFGTKVVTIRVGGEPDHKDFTVHEDGRKRSPYLMDPRNQKPAFISLPDARPEDFNVYVQWLYTGRLHTKTIHFDHGVEWVMLTNVYLLGHKLADVDFQDRVMDSMLDWLKDAGHNIDCLAVVFDNVTQIFNETKISGKNNPLRRLVSDIVSAKLSNTTIQSMALDRQSEQLPPAFLLDIVSKLSTKLVAGHLSFLSLTKSPELRENCHYHCHKNGECYRNK
ncbi:hypothetical protein P171DRAFT_479036 [Karstenula rhodostoma CBS 690.94]|uniref:BTB domain-containing protein n=1 Tax=Karstenula rhodostoma CBS 690.94 TaxID=1392251 RepID=A0A9P4PZ79_9PLEO|nr:hypothetical protein P171DRAFT_479036 [Karstenula rhodostoma CBS 690.94]